MKIRSDFVTNSSSSSYIIAYRKLPEFDAELLEKYPALSCFNKLVELALFTEGNYNETDAGIKITSVEELEAYIKNEYSWHEDQTLAEIFYDEDYAKRQYDKCMEALKRGCNILIKNVDYSDETISNMLCALAESNVGIEIIDRD